MIVSSIIKRSSFSYGPESEVVELSTNDFDKASTLIHQSDYLDQSTGLLNGSHFNATDGK